MQDEQNKQLAEDKQSVGVLDKLLDSLHTQRQAEKLVGELVLVKQRLFDVDQTKLDELLASKLRSDTSEVVRDFFNEVRGVDECEIQINALIEKINQLATVQVTLAIDPGQELLTKIGEYFRRELKRGVLLDIRYDSTLIGGAIVSFGGKYADVSVRRIFDRMADAEELRAYEELEATKKKTELEKNPEVNDEGKAEVSSVEVSEEMRLRQDQGEVRVVEIEESSEGGGEG